VETTEINNKVYSFEKLNFFDALKTQQLIINKIKLDAAILEMIKELDTDDSGMSIFVIFLKVIQSFEPDELIEFIQDLMIRAKVKSDGGILIHLENEFSGNFNLVFTLVFNVLKANYDMSFFLKRTGKNTEEVA